VQQGVRRARQFEAPHEDESPGCYDAATTRASASANTGWCADASQAGSETDHK